MKGEEEEKYKARPLEQKRNYDLPEDSDEE